MIVGIGVDIVDVERFGRALSTAPGLKRRLFTEPEFDLPVRSLAARFAAKEAVAKALGGPGALRWRDVSIVRCENGAPTLLVSGTVAARADALSIEHWHISLSHDAGMAIAMVIAEA